MAAIHEYIVELVEREAGGTDIALLDYGCGAGEIVHIACERGIDASGADIFYEGGSYRHQAEQTGLLNDRIFEMKEGVVPFADAHFDVVVSNQVFEHIDDFTQPLNEVTRVLRPGGLFINLFPSKMVWREGHIGIPFAHWFDKQSSLRHYYTLILRSLGAGYNKNNYSPRDWARVNLAWIDQWTFYKPRSEVMLWFGTRYDVKDKANDYFRYRLKRHPRLRVLAGAFELSVFDWMASYLCQCLAGHVFVMTKKGETP